LRTRSPADLQALLHFLAGRGWRVKGADVIVLRTSLEGLGARVLFAELHRCAAAWTLASMLRHAGLPVSNAHVPGATHLCACVQRHVQPVRDAAGLCSDRRLASFSRHAARRASWVGDTNKLWRASDAAFGELVGTDADYHHFKRISGAAAVQRAVEEARASLPRLDPAPRVGGAPDTAAQQSDDVVTWCYNEAGRQCQGNGWYQQSLSLRSASLWSHGSRAGAERRRTVSEPTNLWHHGNTWLWHILQLRQADGQVRFALVCLISA
jgi:hypothetical protein